MLDLMNRQPATQPPVDPQKLAIIQLLLQQGVSIEQVATILNAQQPQQAPVSQQYPLSPRGRLRDSRSRSPPPRRRSPSRSMSPPPRGRGRGRRRDSLDSPPPRRRRSPSYDDYRRRSPSRSRSPPLKFRRNSPPPRKASPVRKPPPITELTELKPLFIEYDESLKPDRIRGTSVVNLVLIVVLSRTLFVGGVTNRISEDKLRSLFG